MEISHPAVAFQDDRGRIIDIMEAIDFNSATMISSNKGATRGNHYHQKTTQWIYVLRGRLLAHARAPDGARQSAILESGDLIKNPPLEQHAFIALEDSELLVLSAGLRSGKDYVKDTYRLDKPVQDD